MKIYISSYAAYNSALLVGGWFDLSDYTCSSDLLIEASDLLKRQAPHLNHEELMYQDWENIPSGMISEHGADWDALFALSELDEDDRAKIEAYDRQHGSHTQTDLQDKIDSVVAQVEPCPFDREWRDWCTDQALTSVLASQGIEATQGLLDALSPYVDDRHAINEAEHDFLYDQETGCILYRHA